MTAKPYTTTIGGTMRLQFMPTADVHLRITCGLIPTPVSVICFRDHNTSLSNLICHPGISEMLAIEADDEEEGPLALTRKQADLIARFAEVASESNSDLVICCKGGVGRSAACAAAILWCSKTPEAAEQILRNGRLSPNRHVFDLVCEALRGPVTEAEEISVENLFDENLREFMRLNAPDD